MHPNIPYKFHSAIYSLKSAKEYVVQSIQTATDTLPSKYHSKNTNPIPDLPDFYGVRVSNMERLIVCLMGQHSLKRHLGSCFSLWMWMLLLRLSVHEQLKKDLSSCFFLLKSKQTHYWAKSANLLLLPSSRTPLPVRIRYATLPTWYVNFFVASMFLSHGIYQLVYHGCY